MMCVHQLKIRLKKIEIERDINRKNMYPIIWVSATYNSKDSSFSILLELVLFTRMCMWQLWFFVYAITIMKREHKLAIIDQIRILIYIQAVY